MASNAILVSAAKNDRGTIAIAVFSVMTLNLGTTLHGTDVDWFCAPGSTDLDGKAYQAKQAGHRVESSQEI